jgi:uncharacterized surface protein with fasciclin (FAS1) repeats
MAKKNSSNIITFLVLLAVVAITYLIVKSIGCYAGNPSGENYSSKSYDVIQAKDIVDTAVDADQFKTLVAAVKAAGLVETLKGNGPFTVFAPTDAAFAKIPAGTVELLLKPENKAMLTNILINHVVPGKVMATDVVKMNDIKTIKGDSLKVSTMGNKVKINDANVLTTDIVASNGVIHVIDTVLMPKISKYVQSKCY